MIEEATLDLLEDDDRMAHDQPAPASTEWTAGWPQAVEAFERLVEVFQHRLVWYAFRRLGDRHEAEDAVQDVFLKVYTERDRMRTVQCVQPYLYRMASNICTDRLRQRQRQSALLIEKYSIEAFQENGAAATEQMAVAEELARVERLLGQLPQRQAEVIRLRVLDEMPLSEAAKIAGCTLATAKSRLRYGLQKLRRIVSRTKENER